MTLNGLAMASGNYVVLLASLAATGVAYAYRIKVEDAMLVAQLGAPYAAYRAQVRALIPIPRAGKVVMSAAREYISHLAPKQRSGT